jgi:aspartate aminotransferase-like enzyme
VRHQAVNGVSLTNCDFHPGSLNSIESIGELAHEVGALFYVDFVSSGGGVHIPFQVPHTKFCNDNLSFSIKKWNIDLGLLGTQKVLSLPPDLGITIVSERSWKIIEDVNYVGYDALLPWKNGLQNRYFPYTHNWRAIAALNYSLNKLLEEGLFPFKVKFPIEKSRSSKSLRETFQSRRTHPKKDKRDEFETLC